MKILAILPLILIAGGVLFGLPYIATSFEKNRWKAYWKYFFVQLALLTLSTWAVWGLEYLY